VKKVHIYNDPPPREVLERIAASLPGGAEELVSKRSRRYRELGLAGRALSSDEWLRLLEEEPRLLRRPILWDGERAVVGFDRKAYEEGFPGRE